MWCTVRLLWLSVNKLTSLNPGAASKDVTVLATPMAHAEVELIRPLGCVIVKLIV